MIQVDDTAQVSDTNDKKSQNDKKSEAVWLLIYEIMFLVLLTAIALIIAALL
jgi:hypothetical protein